MTLFTTPEFKLGSESEAGGAKRLMLDALRERAKEAAMVETGGLLLTQRSRGGSDTKHHVRREDRSDGLGAASGKSEASVVPCVGRGEMFRRCVSSFSRAVLFLP